MVQRSFYGHTALSLAVSAALILALSHAIPARAAQSARNASPAAASFSGWQARIVGNEASPSRLIAVDKKAQTLFLFERHSPLRLAGKYPCTTGQNAGDKFSEGDLRTPEGVYFIIQRIASGLDYEKYGYEAYTLNYPNPVDKLRRKTGYGIWIHGRGVPITPNLTEGCVSLNNTDIAVLGKNLTPGTPVALAEAVRFESEPTPEDMAIVNALYKKTHDWAKAWSSRSKKFFDYYDAEAYALAQGESFDAFRQQKERVFKRVSFIDTKVRNVQALQGPGYWVTWFQQDYRASNLSSKGVRRLYWQKDKQGDLRIVGMEWAPHLYGTLTAGLNGAPVASEPAKPDKAPAKPVAVAVAPAVPAQPIPAAPQSAPEPRQTPAPAPRPVATAAPAPQPALPAREPIAVALAEMGAKPAPAAKAEPRAAKPVPGKPGLGDVTLFVERWRKAWEKGDLNAYAACYAANAIQGGRQGATAIRNHKAGLWRRSSPKQVVLTNIRITSKQGMVVVDMHQAYTDSKSFADMGVKTLYLQAEGDAWRIVREDWSPMQ
ncbi:MAG: L,D-transpeptidase [Deltaproteobacteria bacterium]|nr:L,D-transpeptidase [Deltaproteobacteria bacterium]